MFRSASGCYLHHSSCANKLFQTRLWRTSSAPNYCNCPCRFPLRSKVKTKWRMRSRKNHDDTARSCYFKCRSVRSQDHIPTRLVMWHRKRGWELLLLITFVDLQITVVVHPRHRHRKQRACEFTIAYDYVPSSCYKMEVNEINVISMSQTSTSSVSWFRRVQYVAHLFSSVSTSIHVLNIPFDLLFYSELSSSLFISLDVCPLLFFHFLNL